MPQTYDEFNMNKSQTDQKFEELTEIMIGEFDKVHLRNDRIELKLDSFVDHVKPYLQKIDKMETKLDLVVQDVGVLTQRMDNLTHKMDLVVKHLGIKTEK